ncbi:MAG: hypothetical protein M3Y37_00735, partial [Chloroflexota bacterium]|nr:hypothetical protein [Chloroflexota bacterium]
EYPVDRLRSRLNNSFGDRPLTVYLVLFAGAATLMLLLGIVWFSATGDGDEDELICTEIAPKDARAAVLAGQIERVNILVDQDDPINTLTGVQLRFTDGTCRQTPQGFAVRDDLLGVIGAVDLYNNYADGSISTHYRSQDIQTELLASSTPTVTVGPTETLTPTPTATRPPTSTATPTVTPTLVASSTPDPQEAASSPSADGEQRAPVGNPGT